MLYEVIFFVLAVAALVGTGGFLFSRREDRAVVSLALVFASLGGIFAVLGHSFLGAIQVLVYAGAIIVAFLFVVWVVKGRTASGRSLPKIAATLAFALLMELVVLILSLKEKLSPSTFSAAELGKFLLSKYIYLFELVSVVIITGIIASLVLVRKER